MASSTEGFTGLRSQILVSVFEFQVPFVKTGTLDVVFGIMGSLYCELSRCVQTSLLCLIQSHTVQQMTVTAEKPRIVVILRNNNYWFQLRKFFKLRK